MQGCSHVFEHGGALINGPVVKRGGAQPCVYYRLTLIQLKTWGGPGPPGSLGDYIPAMDLDEGDIYYKCDVVF